MAATTNPRLRFTLRIWRQKNRQAQGAMVTYQVQDIVPEMSFLEMLDVLNEGLLHAGQDPVAFDYDCREGICGSCSLFINGRAHGPLFNTATCQLYMRSFTDGDTITVEPWRATAFPLNKDLSCDRSAFDRLIQAGGYVGVNTGGTPDANEILISKGRAERAFESAECIGCGACVAACKNSSAMPSGPAPTLAPARPSTRRASRWRTSPPSTGNIWWPRSRPTSWPSAGTRKPPGPPFRSAFTLFAQLL